MGEFIYQIRYLEHYYRQSRRRRPDLAPALEIERLALAPASIVGLIGPNGSGKSTLLKLLAFAEKPTRGDIFYKGRAALPFSDAVRFQVTLLTQEPYLLKRSVFANVAYGLKLRRDKRGLNRRVLQALAWVGLRPETFARRQWNQLSVGEAQRAALAARLVLQPEVLLLDEPTASVDGASAQLIKDAVTRARREWGTTLVIASHDRSWLHGICDETLHLFKGRVFGDGTENIVFGPWRPRNNGHWAKTLQSGQEIFVPPPPDTDAVAVIASFSCQDLPKESRPGQEVHTLHGIVSQLIFDNPSREVVATINVDNLNFTLRAPQSEHPSNGLSPGQPLDIHYHPGRVAWL